MLDEQSNGGAGSSEIAALAERVATARGKLPLQHDAALVEVLSEEEIAAERDLAEWIRAQRRGQRRRAVQDEIATEKRDRRTSAAIKRVEEADARWHRRALAARRRVANQDARLAQLYRRAEWSSRALIAVVVLGMVWAGVNVQHNLVPSGDMSDPLYWLSYGIEAMISIPIITIMVVATTAARWGRELPRGKIVFFEIALLGTTIGLNAGPHLAAGHWGKAAEYSIAPVMVGVVIWLHAWVSARYAQLIDSVEIVDDNARDLRREPPNSAVPQSKTNGHSYEPWLHLNGNARNGSEIPLHRLNGHAVQEFPESRSVPKVRHNGHERNGYEYNGHQHNGHQHNGHEYPAANGGNGTNGHAATETRVSSHANASSPATSPSAPRPTETQPEPVAAPQPRPARTEPVVEQLTLDADPGPEPRHPRITLDAIAAARDAVEETLDTAPIVEPDEVDGVWAVARAIIERRVSKLPVEQVAEILTLADQSLTPSGIGNEVGISSAAVSRILDAARKLRNPYAVA
ncbi:hypothetical protein [Nocardia sp. XZ_19_385]|uniref:hypothetical protein n=1 Tax=Nocardia sp. XZ_19_385 TaxID=2769488 RepID=UPI00189015FA|nr:hypothetical protein [Nocardia sp. XZ_19_385]